jgi:hypothetical protein
MPAMSTEVLRYGPSQSHQTLDTAHIIEAGGNTKSNRLFPAQPAAKYHVWNTLQHRTL